MSKYPPFSSFLVEYKVIANILPKGQRPSTCLAVSSEVNSTQHGSAHEQCRALDRESSENPLCVPSEQLPGDVV